MKKEIKETKLVAILLVCAIVSLVAYLLIPIFNGRDKMGPKQLTRYKLTRLEMHILHFYSTEKKWPDPNLWKVQIQPLLLNDKAFRPEELLVDSWGKPIVFKIENITNRPTPVLYSFGPNRIDDNCSNDDIVLRFEE